MKDLRFCFIGLATVFASLVSTVACAQQEQQQGNSTPIYQAPQPMQSINKPAGVPTGRVGVVNTKKCLEESKLGKQEQANFEKMKKQMETVLQDKESALEEVEAKLNDDDYMDSISDDAANELKRKKRNLRNEGMGLQNQFIQNLQKANLDVFQKITAAISKASIQVAQDNTLDAILTDEACTYFAPGLDVTDKIIAKMNAIFDSEQKDSASKTR